MTNTLTVDDLTVDDAVVIERLPNGLLRFELTAAAREKLHTDRRQVRELIRAAVAANAGEIAARKRWATIYRGGKRPSTAPRGPF
jgi:hypothetical protein